jgi:8-amino-3,8-dideoxy-alpha-D-manno-octulosonate transaminase
MVTKTPVQELAINGGPQAVPALTGVVEPKLGVEEFFALAQRFGFTPEALERLRATVSNADLLGDGPNLARYWSTFPTPAAGETFEALAREIFQVPFAHSVSNGTAALHAAFVGVGVGPGTEVICPAMGFMATSAAVMLAGGVPVFCDVDASLQLDPTKIEACITPRTVAIAPTHHWGNMCDMDPIMAIARRHNLKVVEDCAQGPGATYKGRYVGTIGDVGCFSISAYKIIGGGEAGMILTRDELISNRARQTVECGGLWRPVRFAPPRYDGELFIGTNYRLSEMESAVDVVQLGKMDRYCAGYRRVSRAVRSRLQPCADITPQQINDADGYIGYMLRFFPATAEMGLEIAAALRAEGIGASCRGTDHAPDWHLARDMFPVNLGVGHVPGGSVYDDPRNAGSSYRYVPGSCPVSEDLFAREVSIGFDPWRSEEDCAAIAAGINKVLAAYCTPDPNGKAWI